MGVVPPALASTDAAGGGGDEVDQLGVGFGDGRALDLATVTQEEPRAVVPGDVDVTDVRIVEQRLEPAEAVEAIEDQRRHGLFLVRRERRSPAGQRSTGDAAELVGDELSCQRPLVVGREPGTAVGLIRGVVPADRLAHDAVDLGDERIGHLRGARLVAIG